MSRSHAGSSPWAYLSFPQRDASQPGEARRAALRLASDLGFDEKDAGRVGVVVTELGTNLVKHAKDGELLLGTRRSGTDRALCVLSLDRGPGRGDFERCFEDGYSTAGSPGNGLGAIRRMASRLEYHSLVGKGTVLFAEVAATGSSPTFRHAGISVAVAGESESGDAWVVRESKDAWMVMVVDGLGHGPHAAAAAVEAVRAFEESPDRGPAETLRIVDGALRKTRGAAVMIARIDPLAGQVTVAGLGNIGGAILTGDSSQGLFTLNGTAGMGTFKCREVQYPWDVGSMLVMHSDGIGTRWRIADYPGLVRSHPAIIAGVLYRDFQRPRDDSTVLVMLGSDPS